MTTVSVAILPHTLAALRRMARDRRVPISHVLREVIVDGLRSRAP